MVQIRGLPGRILRGVPGKMGKKQKPVTKVLTGLAIVYVLGAAGFSLGDYFHALLVASAPLNLAWFNFALAGLTAFVLSFLGSMFMAQDSLFAAKDNKLLLSLLSARLRKKPGDHPDLPGVFGRLDSRIHQADEFHR